MRKCPNLSIWVTLAMLQLSKFPRNFGNSDRNPVKFLLPKLVFSESFLLCSCQGAMPRAVRGTGIPSAVRVRLLTASLEDDTEFFTRFGFSQLVP